jgi:hypothetical protein
MRLRSRLSTVISALLLLYGCGGGGDDSRDPPPDTTPPTVSVSLPATVYRVATITVAAADNVGVTEVEFRVDGVAIGTDTSAPFTASWDTSAAAEGMHSITAVARDAAGNSATSSGVDVEVRNQQQFALTLGGDQENPPTGSAGSASGTIDVNLISGAASGSITVSGFTAMAAHIHDGFAGVNGPIVVGLEQDPNDPTRWQLPAAVTLSSGNIDRLLAGALYVNVHSAQFVGGEVRAQLLPAHVRVFFAALSAHEEPGFVVASGTARGALTVNTDTLGIVAHVTLAGVDSPTAAHIHQGFAGANGPVSIGLTQDPVDANHFFVDDAMLSQAAFDALLAAGLYFNVHTQANPDGHVRAQIVPPDITVVIAELAGLQEVPEVASNARARAAVTFNPATRAIQIHLNSQGAEDATGAHLHRGIAGTNGAIAVGLTQDGSAPDHWFAENASLAQADADALLAAATYLNLHTPANPDGELRGQVAPPGTRVVISRVEGAQEVPQQVTSARGVVALTVVESSGATEVHVNASGVDDANAAHIHDAFAGVNGPVIIGLTQDADPANPGHWFATGASLTPAQLEKLGSGELYANVHTPAAPNGFIRGQLLTPNLELTFTDLSGAEEVPPVTTTATARAATTVDTEAGVVTIHVNTTGLDDANAAHIHSAPAGTDGLPIVSLAQDAALPSRWSAVRAAVTAEQLADYDANNWYVNVHTPANPDGEVRGQIVPNPPPPPDAEAPTVTLGAVPASISGTVTLTATASDDVGVVTARFKVNGTVVGSDSTAPYSFAWNSTTVANGAVTIVAEAQDAAGNVGTSPEATATVSNTTGVTPYTFTELHAQVLGPSCAVSGCHLGAGAPFGLDLASGVAYGNLVNAASGEVPSLLRVAPGNASDSYLIRKLEGTPGIVGVRMPFGGPYLPQSTIDRIRAWIDNGAPND